MKSLKTLRNLHGEKHITYTGPTALLRTSNKKGL